MSKKFGVWINTQKAVIAEIVDKYTCRIVDHVKAEHGGGNSNENSEHNLEKSLQHNFFKEVCKDMQNATSIHITGTGNIQEQFAHYLKETPQFKHAEISDSTSNPMSDEALVRFFLDKA